MGRYEEKDVVKKYLGFKSPLDFSSLDEIEEYFRASSLRARLGKDIDLVDAEKAKQAVVMEWLANRFV